MNPATAPRRTRRTLRTTATAAEQEEAIVEAAEAEFSIAGVQRASVDAIARAAAVSRSTLYRRFPGKEDLLIAVAARVAIRLSARLDGATRGLGPADAVVVSFVDAVRFIRDSPLLGQLLVTEPEMLEVVVANTDSDDGSLIDAIVGSIGETLRRCGATMPDRDLDLVADVLLRLLISIVRTPSSALAVDDEEAIEYLARTVLAPMVS